MTAQACTVSVNLELLAMAADLPGAALGAEAARLADRKPAGRIAALQALTARGASAGPAALIVARILARTTAPDEQRAAIATLRAGVGLEHRRRPRGGDVIVVPQGRLPRRVAAAEGRQLPRRLRHPSAALEPLATALRSP